MALTKLPKAGLATGSVSSDQIEDGTIQNQEFEDGTLTSAKLADSTIANAKLSNSSFTLNGNSISLGASGTFVDGELVEWQTVKTADFTAVAGEGYFVDTTSTAITVTLPASASLGDTIAIKDYAGTFNSNNLTIGRNGHRLQGVTENLSLTTTRASVVLVYADATKGWLFTDEHNVADLQLSTFITATGGTETTTGDFKIHTFTSSGCFAVSTLGAGASGGPSNVDYLVVAGGGGGSGGRGCGGGGAGGYRTTFPSPSCNAGAFPISIQTYPITVGAGGTGGTFPNPAGGTARGAPGSNSIFSTITSAGGGSGNGDAPYPRQAGQPGGSGGGGGSGASIGYNLSLGGLGNTPPVSPSQGSNGGVGNPIDISPFNNQAGGGGGGASTTGSNTSGGTAGAGGAGSPNSITGSAVTYAGGGGGGARTGGPAGAGGSGGGGTGGHGASCSDGTAGTANTGGGGGGAGYAPSTGARSGAAGGSGIVIIRYKYQ